VELRHRRAHRTRRVGAEQLYALFQKELGYKGTPAQFRLLWCDHFTLDRGSYALLKKTAKNVPTYLLSNTNALHIDFIRERYEFPSVVRGAILSPRDRHPQARPRDLPRGHEALGHEAERRCSWTT